MRLKLLLLFFSCAFLFARAQQTQVITGIVKDTKGNPLPGVSVKESTKNGTTTDEQGRFTISLKSASTTSLEFTYIGFLNQKVNVKGKSSVDVVMKDNEAKAGLDEVVVIGTQRQSRRNTTASLSSISGKQIENLPAPSVDVLLQGRISGLNVQVTSGEPGVAPTIVVRGNTRVNTSIGDNAYVSQAQAMSGPLYVIDGIPVNPEDIANNIDATGTNYLAGININDIESVDVQKDAAATAAWGSRGANGVIYIKTKRGRSATPEFRVNVYGGVTEKPSLIKTYTGAEERRLKMDIINQYGTPGQIASIPQILADSLNPYYNNATDWQDLFYRSGAIQNADLTMSAASEVVNYRVSMNYYNEKGIVTATGYQRYALRGNFDFKINSKLNSQLIVALSKGDRQRGKKYNKYDDTKNTPFEGSAQPSSFYRLTPFDSLNFTGLYDKLRNKNIDDNYTVSYTANYAILPTLKYTFQGSANISSSSQDYFQPSNIDEVSAISDGGNAQPSFAQATKGTFSTYFISNALNYTKKFNTGQHTQNLAVTGAQQFTTDVAKGNSVSGYNVPSNDIQVVSGIPQTDLSGSSYYAKDALLSVMGQVQYDLDGKYLLYGSYRGDASSRFGANTKWGYFPAVGAGWIISDENFMKNSTVVNFLKLRGSWGVSGTQSADFYAPFNSYIIPGTYNGGIAIQPSYSNGLTKNDLTWARTNQKNIGVEAQLFNSRINITADIYDKISKDDYYNFVLPFYTGFSGIKFNAHDLWVSNRGLDLSVSTRNLSAKSKLKWNSQLVLTFNKNAIAKLPNNNRTFVVSDWYGVDRIFAVGQPIYRMFQMQYQGVYNTADEIPFNPLTGNRITYYKGYHPVVPGDPIWKDVNGDFDVWSGEDNGDQFGDRVPTGNPNPKFTGGFTNDFTYGNFSLTIVSVFSWKRDVVNTFFQQQLDGVAGNIQNFSSRRLPDLSGLDYWTPEKAAQGKTAYHANFPAINPFSGYYYQFFPFTDMWNVDGSYFKVKYLIAGYQLPKSFISKMKLKSARIYGMVDNVLIIKNKNNTMPDPEAVDQLGIYTGGLYPQSHKFTFGLDIQF